MLAIRATRPQRLLTLLAAALATALAARTLTWAGFFDKVKKGVKKASQELGKTRGQSKKTAASSDPAAVRGIEEDAGEPEGEAARDGGDLEWLEAFSIGDEDVERFVREGKLKP
ncbi:MAG: hypothetical protein WC728_06715 [Elusimicrobiota bacterium]